MNFTILQLLHKKRIIDVHGMFMVLRDISTFMTNAISFQIVSIEVSLYSMNASTDCILPEGGDCMSQYEIRVLQQPQQCRAGSMTAAVASSSRCQTATNIPGHHTMSAYYQHRKNTVSDLMPGRAVR